MIGSMILFIISNRNKYVSAGSLGKAEDSDERKEKLWISRKFAHM